MCGRFTLGATAATLAAQFDLANVPPGRPATTLRLRKKCWSCSNLPSKIAEKPDSFAWGPSRHGRKIPPSETA
jgi:hypothetical protein